MKKLRLYRDSISVMLATSLSYLNIPISTVVDSVCVHNNKLIDFDTCNDKSGKP